MQFRFERALIVDDDSTIVAAIRPALASWAEDVAEAGTVAQALESLPWKPDLIILDVALPDGSGLEVASRACALRPIPRIVAMSGSATASEAFELSQLGGLGYLAKPFTTSALEQLLERISGSTPDLALIGAQCVGPMSLVEVQDVVRRSMTAEALARVDGNRSKAASVLGVSRQVLQYAARGESDDPD